jgi:hypothetical protein
LLVAVSTASQTLASDRRVFQYSVEHPTYGQIGTYTNIVEGTGSETRVSSELHIAVKFLGVTVHRVDATRTELWRGDRLTFFNGVTVTNGDAIRVAGEAMGTHFVITSPTGTTQAPADVKPSNPWSISLLHDGTMMSTKTGKLFQAHIGSIQADPIGHDGHASGVRRYEVDSDKQEFIWFDERGVAVAFSTEDEGTRIKFVLARD